MKKSTFFVINLLIAIAIIFIPINTTFATDVKTWDQMSEQAKDFIDHGKQTTVISNNDITSTIMPIAQMLVAFAAGVMVIVTCIMGIKYATASSPDEQAKLKKQLVGLVVSIIVVFGAQAIWAIIYNFMKDF